MTEIEQAATEAAASAAELWVKLVRLTLVTPSRQFESAAKAISGPGWKNTKDKLDAIYHAMGAGKSFEEIVRRGQTRTISDLRKAKAKKRQEQNLEPWVPMTFMVSQETWYAIKEEIHRHCQILKIRDTETYFTFLHAEMQSWTPQQLRHAAGESDVKIHRIEKAPIQRERACSARK